jgi:hypothetical protein
MLLVNDKVSLLAFMTTSSIVIQLQVGYNYGVFPRHGSEKKIKPKKSSNFLGKK